MPDVIPATVRHITRDHVTIAPAKGYSVIVFNVFRDSEDFEVIVAAEDGSETIRLLVAGPAPGYRMSIKTSELGVVDIVYTKEADARV